MQEIENTQKQWLASYNDSSREQAMIISVRVLMNEFCLSVFTSKDLHCHSLSVTSPMVRPCTRPSSGIVHIWHPKCQFPTVWAKIFCLSDLYSLIHACWPWFRLKSTKISTQPFSSFHRKSNCLSMSSHLSSLMKMLWKHTKKVAYGKILLFSKVQTSLKKGLPSSLLVPNPQTPLPNPPSSPTQDFTQVLPSLVQGKSILLPAPTPPKARVSIETNVEYAAEFQESRQENILVRDEAKQPRIWNDEGVLRERVWERIH